MRHAPKLLPLLLTLACAGSAPTPTQYLLRGEAVPGTEQVPAARSVRLERVSVAPYLDQTGLVVEVEPGQLQAARQHLWAEPLGSGLLSLLRSELSSALGRQVSAGPGRASRDYVVWVYVDELHGSMRGSATIDASYRIESRGAQPIREYRFSRSTPLPREGYPGLVDAQVSLTQALARAIADSLREIEEAPAP
jgi:uncharacterized lipoprotein YmbA